MKRFTLVSCSSGASTRARSSSTIFNPAGQLPERKQSFAWAFTRGTRAIASASFCSAACVLSCWAASSRARRAPATFHHQTAAEPNENASKMGKSTANRTPRVGAEGSPLKGGGGDAPPHRRQLARPGSLSAAQEGQVQFRARAGVASEFKPENLFF